jgi:hypothetical protein
LFFILVPKYLEKRERHKKKEERKLLNKQILPSITVILVYLDLSSRGEFNECGFHLQ